MTQDITYIKTKKTYRTINRYGVLWQCSDAGHFGNRIINPPKKGCGHYNGDWTLRLDGDRNNQWYSKCVNCGKKTSLNAGKVLAKEVTREALKEAVNHLNGVVE